MGKELVISSNRHETKVAVLEDDQLVEIYFQRANEYSLAGSIHKGRVTRVLPGMQSAFVDLGLERDAFLYVSDFFEENEEYDRMTASSDQRLRRPERTEPSKAAAASAPAAAEQAPEADAADQKSRRSRRRRNKGRGFPESKYASTAPPPPPAEPGDFEVLPGEQLAKYRVDGAVGDAVPESEQETAEELAGVDATALAPLSSPEQAEAEQPLEEPAPEAGIETEAEDEPELAAPAAVQPAPEDALGPAAVPEPDSPASPAPEAGSWPVLGEEGPEPAAASGGEPEIPQESRAGAEAEAQKPAGGIPAAGPEQSSSTLRAELRDGGTRYQHRISRRLRRKMRGGPAEQRHQHREEPEPAAPHPAEQAAAAPAEKAAPSISDLLHEGQEILVQIAKEPLGQKGARITSHIALPGRYVVYMPTVDHMGVSRKIASDEERHRLRHILQTHRTGMTGGFIVRTAGEGQSERDIAADMSFLYNLWLDIRQKAERKPAPALAHHDLDIVQRLLRDQFAGDFKAVWVDSESVYESVLRFVERTHPGMVPHVKLYTRSAPIFDTFGITAELEKALRPKVWLKSGGYIVVNQTEALVAIDVNTGKFVGKSNRLEDTIVKTNTEAIREIVRQIRLRDLGGIIVVDFIDMDERKNRQKVMQALEDEMRRDRAPYKILQFNDFGLVAITRKRVKQSLERALCMPCPACEGAGYVKSVQTVIGDILQEAVKIAPAIDSPNAVLRVHPEVARVLKSTENEYLEELEEIVRRPVLVTGDPLLHPEKWDLA
ncbi:MAG: Rne/Rng family ribonuclease [Bryobacterales bacterium]|nr:Rne/Rng family ribonuclease [Bryobacterales bacterium]